MNDKIMKMQEETRLMLAEKIYGEIPKRPIHLDYTVKTADGGFAAGKATLAEYEILMELSDRTISMPMTAVIPNGRNNIPAIISLTDKSGVPNKYLPAEEIIDRGYAIFQIQVDDIACNNADFKAKICGQIARSRKRRAAPGKIAVWAFGIMRATDTVCDLEVIDKDAICVCGHGIFARAGMLAAAFDKRISYVIANGIASYPMPYSNKIPKSGITVRDFPYMYCPAFIDEPIGDEISLLLSVIAPRKVMIGYAEDGVCCDFEAEYRRIYKISEEFYKPQGLSGIGKAKEIPTAEGIIQGGEISCHLRQGLDYFSREDWNIYLDFIDSKISKI